MKTERLFSILLQLLQKKRISAEQLAQTFEVSKRTIYRDIESLSVIGIPIVAHIGKNGGYTLMDNYQLNEFTFSEKEKKALLESLLLKQQLFNNEQLVSLRQKLLLLMEQEDKSPISLATPTFHRPIIERENQRKMNEILLIIEQKQRMSIHYISQNGAVTNRNVSPFHLHFTNGSWYVEAFCHMREAIRHFKMTRIRQLTVLEEPAEQNHFGTSTTTKPNLAEIQLQFPLLMLGKLYDFFTEQEMVITEHVTVSFQYDLQQHLLPFLLMFGRHITICSPESLRRQYQQEVEKMLKG